MIAIVDSAFGTPSFGSGLSGVGQSLSHEDMANMMNPMASHFATQATQHALANPANPEAQRTAAYWTSIAQRQQLMQQQLQAAQQQQAAAPAAPPVAAPVWAPVPSTLAPAVAPAVAPVPGHLSGSGCH